MSSTSLTNFQTKIQNQLESISSLTNTKTEKKIKNTKTAKTTKTGKTSKTLKILNQYAKDFKNLQEFMTKNFLEVNNST